MALPGLDTVIPGIMTARYAGGSIMLGGIDILAGVPSQSVISFTYSDNTSDKADDLTVEIADPARTWMQSYLPKKGVEVESIIRVFNWNAPGDMREFNCGTMWVDEINFSGPPNIVTLKAVSIPVNTGLKTEKQYKFWEGQSLQDIAAEIALLYQLALVWDTTNNPKLKRTDIIEMAHLEYLRDRAKDEGLSIKIFNRQLIIYSEEEYEAKPPLYVIAYGMSQILNFNFISKLNDTYKSAKNAYVSPESGELIEGEFIPSVEPEGSGAVLNLNERVEEEEGTEGEGELRTAIPRVDELPPIDFNSANAAAQEAATKKAKSKLREKNKREKECSFIVVGNPGYISGLNAQLVGFGIFDGKWQIFSSVHAIGEDGYTTELRMRACLEGY